MRRMKPIPKSLAFAITAIVAVALLAGCTSNQRAKTFGGTMTVEIPADSQFVNATWKQDSLWYITAPRQPGHAPTTYTMREDSNFGIVEGAVKFVEK